MNVSRRTFIKTGVVGGAVLATAGWTTHDVFWGSGSARARVGGQTLLFFTAKDYRMMHAIVPVILAGALGDNPRDIEENTHEVIVGMDGAIGHFQAEVQAELRQLFALMTMPPGRTLAAGVWSSWEKASPETIEKFLNRWRYSSTTLFKTAYDALQQLTAGAWYGNPKSWPTIGYPGAPALG